VTKALLKRAGISNFRKLAGVIMCPTLRPDGSLLSYLGYDEKTGLLLVEPPVVPDIAETPTREDALAALADLDSLLIEFPFVDDASHSVALSAMITPVVRGALVCVPLHAVTAPEAGTGKSHLLDTCAAIALGQSCPPFAAGRDQDEFDKRLHAELRSGTSVFAIDNVTIELGGDALCQAIERPVISLRILGRTERIQLPNTFTIYANGNNLSFVDDVNRRVLRCGLDAKMEEPRKRQFKGDPVRTVRADRGRYIAAALTVVRAYVVAGRPDRQPGIGEPFAQWSDMVRSALIWLGRVDPVMTMDIAHDQDPEFRLRLQVFQAIFEEIGTQYTSTGDLIEKGRTGLGSLYEALKLVCERRGELSALALGKWFGANNGKVAGGMVLERDVDRHTKAWVWRVKKVGCV
jgi:putative DNA primase/helicase